MSALRAMENAVAAFYSGMAAYQAFQFNWGFALGNILFACLFFFLADRARTATKGEE